MNTELAASTSVVLRATAGVLIFSLWAVAPAGQAAAQSAAQGLKGTLRIQGGSLQALTLVDRQNQPTELKKPGPSVSLPAGEYRVQRVELQGGYSCYRYRPAEEEWFVVRPGEATEVVVGAPLTPTIKIQRQGRVLVLDYRLLDASGGNYRRSSTNLDNSPTFTVYGGDREVGSGTFRYG